MNLTELNLYLSSRKQIESDHYLDSFINIETEGEKDKDKKITGMKRKYKLGLRLRDGRRNTKAW